jgi:hypothetical protein
MTVELPMCIPLRRQIWDQGPLGVARRHLNEISLTQGTSVRFVAAILKVSMTGVGRLQPVAWKIGCTSALDPEAAVGELPH